MISRVVAALTLVLTLPVCAQAQQSATTGGPLYAFPGTVTPPAPTTGGPCYAAPPTAVSPPVTTGGPCYAFPPTTGATGGGTTFYGGSSGGTSYSSGSSGSFGTGGNSYNYSYSTPPSSYSYSYGSQSSGQTYSTPTQFFQQQPTQTSSSTTVNGPTYTYGSSYQTPPTYYSYGTTGTPGTTNNGVPAAPTNAFSRGGRIFNAVFGGNGTGAPVYQTPTGASSGYGYSYSSSPNIMQKIGTFLNSNPQ